MLKERSSVAPLGASDELPPTRHDFARKRITETGPCGGPRSRAIPLHTRDRRGNAERPEARCQSPVDPQVGIGQPAPRVGRSRHAIGQLAVVKNRPAARRAPHDVDPPFRRAPSVIPAAGRLVAAERKTTGLPPVQAQRDAPCPTGLHQRLVHGHVPRAGRGPVDHAPKIGRAQASVSPGKLHFRSSCLAARPSSSRRTGVVCGAVATISGSVSASLAIAFMAAA